MSSAAFGIDRLSPDGGVWTGPLDALLDAWTEQAGYAWRYDAGEGVIGIVRREAVAFRIHALAGRQRYEASGSTDDGVSGGDEGGGVSTRQSIMAETDYDPWPEIEAQAAALAGPGASVTAAPSSASLLVSGTPRDVERVRTWLAWLNREVLRPVTLSVHVYAVRMEREADYGFGLAALVKELFGTSAELAVEDGHAEAVQRRVAERHLARWHAAAVAGARAWAAAPLGSVLRVMEAGVPGFVELRRDVDRAFGTGGARVGYARGAGGGWTVRIDEYGPLGRIGPLAGGIDGLEIVALSRGEDTRAGAGPWRLEGRPAVPERVAASRLKALGLTGGPAPASGGIDQPETLVPETLVPEKEAEDGTRTDD